MERTADFTVAVTHEAGDHVVIVAGDVDMATAPQFAAAVSTVGGPGARVVFDLSSVTFMDSSGLSVIATTLLRLRQHGGSACVRGASPWLRQTIKITGLDQCHDLEVA